MVQSKKLTIIQLKSQVETHLNSAGDNEMKKSICTLMNTDLQATHSKLLETEGQLTRLLIGSEADDVKIKYLNELPPMIDMLKSFSYLSPYMPG